MSCGVIGTRGCLVTTRSDQIYVQTATIIVTNTYPTPSPQSSTKHHHDRHNHHFQQQQQYQTTTNKGEWTNEYE